ncbi:hypothetical protein [Paenibacillus rigui]|uniref:Uncharacterized protein n=1 Tax=Paenibacillus rigui TaxID=554312 RepID=A0A229UQX7_9BACL|nr:hypothetical protein [Paenibacillus rigui]OXM85808.1 hypothetical protein CF651_11260 [Paenibacillus rigui]
MLSKFFTRIYFALSGFKNNVKSLSKSDLLDDDGYVVLKTNINDIEEVFNRISYLFEGGFDKDEIQHLIGMIGRLALMESVKANYNVYYNQELMGLLIIVHMDELLSPSVYFLSEEKLTRKIQLTIETLTDPESLFFQ